MTVDDTRKVIATMIACYPNYKPDDMKMTVAVWANMLADYDAVEIGNALKAYIATDTTGFAPSIGQLTAKLNQLKNGDQLNGNEAWTLVYKALCNSTYHAQEEFDKLPPLVQKAVGSADSLKAMATNNGFNEDVEKSHFIRIYDTVCKRADEAARLPMNLQALVQKTNKQIGVNNNGIDSNE